MTNKRLKTMRKPKNKVNKICDKTPSFLTSTVFAGGILKVSGFIGLYLFNVVLSSILLFSMYWYSHGLVEAINTRGPHVLLSIGLLPVLLSWLYWRYLKMYSQNSRII